ncbi:hypothetical protein ACS0TY_014462 [Phlomoides rotata]
MAAFAAVVSLKHHISTILTYDVLLPPLSMKTFELAHKELKSFQNFVERLNSKSRKRMNASLGPITEAIRKFEKDLGDKEGIHSLIEMLKKTQLEYYSSLKDEEEVVSKSKMVGLCDVQSKLKEEIVGDWVENNVFSVVGMVGIGKTTLAREIFEDLDTSEWFNCRAWVRVGNELKPEEITDVILAQVDPEAHQMLKGGDEEEMTERLKEILKSRRYLIVLDDVWSYNVHAYLKNAFPDNRNGSRVLLTTRIKYVAQDVSFSSRLIDMRLLDKEESWQLLCDKVFSGNSCPPHLEEAGKKIAEKCDGLPLTILTVANLLSKAEETPAALWFDVAEKKKHQVFIDAYDQISKVLYPSYKKLGDELKLCFLYMGVFPPNFEIPRCKLINLWVAEEVVKPSAEQTLESRAVKCLQYLDFHSLVMVYQKSTRLFPAMLNEKIKTCGLHSCWWNLCQREARKSYFFHVLDSYKDGLEEVIRSQSRLSIHNNVIFALKDVYNSMEEKCAITARSLLCFGPYNQYMVPICFGLKFLQRLDALNIRFYFFPLEVLELVKLRYLTLTCNGKLPPSISKLRDLQYLIVHRHMSIKSSKALSYLPTEIWDMSELNHLDVTGCDLPDLGNTSLPKLSTLSDVSTGSCVVLKRVPNLKKLGIRIELTPNATEPLSCFGNVSHLVKLESLKCVIVNPEYKPEVVPPVALFPRLPFLLHKLSLSGLGYPWSEMSNVASLPFLKVLKLRYNAFQGPMWEVEENGFQKLNFLQMEDIDLVELKGARGSFKRLEILRIKHCYKLKKLCLGDFESVWNIEVVDCNPLVEKNIKETIVQKKDYTLEDLRVHSSWKL